MKQALRAFLFLFGVVCVVIPTLIYFFGASNVGDGFASVFGLATPIPGLGDINADSELRFYSVFFAGYGLLVLWMVRHKRLELTPYVLLPFFLGGLGRLLSAMSLGMPHPLFQALMVLELCLPPIFLLMWLIGKRS